MIRRTGGNYTSRRMKTGEDVHCNKHLRCGPRGAVVSIALAFAILGVLLGTPLLSFAQDNRREIIIDFPSKRPKPKKAIRRKPPVYKLAEERPGSTNTPLSPNAQLGVTVWHLRPAKRTDAGARTLLSGDERTEYYVALRGTTDTPLRPEERVRLSIESGREGYLYVIDRELFPNGQVGPPNLIFPDPINRGSDNKVRAGRLIEIPPRESSRNFFWARPSKKNQIGELLNIIVTAARLDLRTDDSGIIPASDLAKWEAQWGRGIQKFEMVGGAGQQWTDAEKDAGSKSGRRLTQDEAAPQTVFSSPDQKDDGLMISVTLRYVRPRPTLSSDPQDKLVILRTSRRQPSI